MGVNKNNNIKSATLFVQDLHLTSDRYIDLVGGRACGLRHHWSEKDTICAQGRYQKNANHCENTENKEQFDQLLFTCCESNLKRYHPQIRHDFFNYLLQNISILKSMYNYLKNCNVPAERYEIIIENAKMILQRNFSHHSSRLALHLKSMINHTIYGLAREALL
jgi:hypothetical protein